MKKVLSILLLSSILSSCAFAMGTKRRTPPKAIVEIWAGYPDEAGIRRSQAGQVLQCANPKFKGYMCMTYEDFQEIIDTYITSCRRWK